MAERSIAIPGMIVAEGDYTGGDYTVRTEKGWVATRLGVTSISGRRISVIPYAGPYRPRQGDFLIGIVQGYGPNGWYIDISTPSRAFLPAVEVLRKRSFDPRSDELSEVLRIGDVVSVKVLDTGRTGHTVLTMKDRGLEKIEKGYFFKVGIQKIPRIIGKKASMLKVLQEGSGSSIAVGQNGVIAVKGSYEAFLKVRSAIDIIEQKTFAKGLTEEVASVLGLKPS
jgi:exosome complex component RRP4